MFVCLRLSVLCCGLFGRVVMVFVCYAAFVGLLRVLCCCVVLCLFVLVCFCVFVCCGLFVYVCPLCGY